MNSPASHSTDISGQPRFDSLLNRLLSDFILFDRNDIDRVIEHGLKLVTEYFDVDEAYIGMLNSAKDDWVYFYKWTFEGGLVKGGDKSVLPLSAFPWSKKWVMRGHGIIVDRIEDNKLLKDKVDLPVYLQAGVKSLLIEPLTVREKIVPGVIALWSRDRYVTWTKDDPTNLRLLGDLLANIIESRRIEEDRIKREKYITLLNRFTQYAFETGDFHDILTKMSADLCDLMQADFCGFGLLDDERKTVLPTGVSGINASEFLKIGEIPAAGTMTEYVLRTGKRLILENIEGSDFADNVITKVVPIKSFIVVPIKTAKKKIGSSIIGYLEPRVLTDQEIDMCQQAAAQITLSINNIQSYMDNVHHIEEMNTLSIMSTALRKAQSLSEIPKNVIDRVIAMRLAENVAMVIHENPDAQPSLAEGGGNWVSSSKEALLAKLTPIIGKVMETGKVILDDEFNTNCENIEIQKDASSQHVLGFPLKANLQTLGVFCVGSKNSFDEKHISLLNALSETIANAVYRQSVFDNMQVHLETLRNTKIQLVQSEKLAAIGELIAGVAHELNNPLTTISLSAELLLQQSVNEQDIYDLGKIVSEAQRAAKIVRSLLDFSRQRAPERQSVAINQLIKSTTDLVSWELVKNNINWHFAFADGLPLTVADPNQLKQVFINIINNSVQAIKKQNKPGDIKIITEVGKPLFFGKVASEENVIRIIFYDTGPGIPPPVLPRIFDPFFTTKGVNEGTGLGLSVCHGIITEHKGHIWAENVDEGGTKIIIEIPIIVPDEHAEDGSRAATDRVSTNERLLIIEDEEDVLEVMQRALMRKGFTIDGVNSGEEGLKYLKENTYSLIICDIRMSGMNGFDFYQAVQKFDPKLARKIVFTSGDSIKPESMNFIKMTGAMFLPKPFELSHLVNVVQERINSLNGEKRFIN
jgi:signal transduction histidine kinase/ActR/RegA family two-component response regulator